MAKTKILGFRLTFEEYELLRLMAKREKRVNSEMLREIIREAAMARQLLPVALVSFEKYRGEYGSDTKINN